MSKSRWYVFDPDNGIRFFDTEDEARSRAESILDEYRDDSSDGWSEEVDDLHWGEIANRHVTKQVNVVDTPGGEFDFTCNYVFVEAP